MNKVTFLNPPFSAEELYGDLSEGGSELPPLGLALMAAVTREQGYQVKIIDAAALRLSYDDTLKAILQESPDVLGITSTTITIYNAATVARMVKKANDRMKIVIGGTHVTACPRETMAAFPEFDVGVVGEGEITFLELLQHFKEEKGLNGCLGLVFQKNGETVFTGRREFIKDLDQLPFPAWDLLPNLVDYYQPAADSLNRSPATLLITSRGCAGKCIFCEKSMFGNLYRGYSAEYIVRMVEHLQKNYGIKEIFFEDDNFLVFRKTIQDFCRLLKEKKLDLSFSVMGRVDAVNPQTLKMLKDAGCWQIGYGCESGSQKILDIINKGVKVEQIEKALRLTREAGLKIKGLFMIGNFGETKETIAATFSFIRNNPMDDFHINCFTPFPGTEAARLASQYGKFDPDWHKANMISPDNFIPHGMTFDDMLYYHKKAYRIFYLRPRIVIYYLQKMMKSRKLFIKILRGMRAFVKYTICTGTRKSDGHKNLPVVQ